MPSPDAGSALWPAGGVRFPQPSSASSPLETSPPVSVARILTVAIFLSLMTFAIIGRLAVIQLLDHRSYAASAANEHDAGEVLLAHRGPILDRNGFAPHRALMSTLYRSKRLDRPCNSAADRSDPGFVAGPLTGIDPCSGTDQRRSLDGTGDRPSLRHRPQAGGNAPSRRAAHQPIVANISRG